MLTWFKSPDCYISFQGRPLYILPCFEGQFACFNLAKSCLQTGLEKRRRYWSCCTPPSVRFSTKVDALSSGFTVEMFCRTIRTGKHSNRARGMSGRRIPRVCYKRLDRRAKNIVLFVLVFLFPLIFSFTQQTVANSVYWNQLRHKGSLCRIW